MTLAPSVQQVISELENAEQVFKSVDGSSGGALAIHAAADFLLREGVPPKLLIPLYSVLGNIVDHGDESNLKPIMEAMQWGQAAGAVTVLKNGGISLPEAASKVARAAGQAFSAQQIIEFRKNIHKQRARPHSRRARPEAVAEYEERVKAAKTRPPELREGIVLQLIAKICAEGKKG
ncbi:hypothetical protein [Mesorhizobium australicum]|uniref:hypothetical protein n=1 Tax=Mesorhizobium australicum TaxID=536018 RepID=UPI0033386C7B